jgi:cytoskeletal protein RodZ
MTKFTRRSLSGLDLRILAALAVLVPGFSAPFALGITAQGEDMTDDEKKKKDDAKKSEDDKKDEEKKDAKKSSDDEKKEEDKKDAKKASDDEDEDDEEEDKKQPQAKASTPLQARLAGIFAAAKGQGPAQSAAALTAEQTAHTATRASLTQAQADLAAARASLASTESAFGTLCAYVGIKPADIAGKSAAEITAALDAKVSAQAIEQVAGLGFNPKGLPAPSGTTGSEQRTKAELYAEYNGIKDPNERAAFYAKHREQLLG